ncbi:MAG: ABC transporter substrate-binding protein [Anaerotignum sp.]|nr:ABC transporter substrate-binding protein [Anaerotignum sp.]MBR6542676.1 ABC transporter substrate-binding protein [Anaerotignum sp.]
MKKLTKLTALLMTAAMVMTGCGGGSEEAASTDAKYTVGIIQQMEHAALDAATQGFQDKLTELLGDDVAFDYQNAQGEQTNCTTIATKFVSDGVDLIMANATTALQSAYAATADIPIVGTSVTDYVTAGVVDSNEAPGRNVTGVSDLSSIDAQIDVLLQFCAEDTKVAVVYCSAEPNSIYQAELAEAYLKSLGRDYAVYTVADSNEIQAVLTNAVGECGAVYIPTDNTLANNMEIVKNVTVPAGVPSFAGAEQMCVEGALSTLSISYYDLGVRAGEMAYEILVNGANPAEMPVEFVSEGITPKYNADIAAALGVTVPEGMATVE